MLQAGPPEGWADLSEALLVSVFSALDHPSGLLACACVCNAWRQSSADAVLPKLALHHDDLDWLIQLNHEQMAAVRDVDMGFICPSPQGATDSVMLLAFICGRLSMLQRLMLHWGALMTRKIQKRCVAQQMPDMVCKTDSTCALIVAGGGEARDDLAEVAF